MERKGRRPLADPSAFNSFGAHHAPKGHRPEHFFSFSPDVFQKHEDPWTVDPWADEAPKLVDSSFESSLNYSIDTYKSDHQLQFSQDTSQDDPFDGHAFGDFKVFPTENPSNLFQKLPTIGIKIDERLSITIEDDITAPTCKIIGSISVVKPKSNVRIRSFCLTVRDRKSNVAKWEERRGICRNITANMTHLALDSSDQVFRVSVRTMESPEIPILAYVCDPSLKPIPVLVKTKVLGKEDYCRVGLRIRANPNKLYNLKNVTVVMVVPPTVDGENVALSRKGGIWDAMKRTLSWTIEQLPPGEVIDIQAKFQSADGEPHIGRVKFPVLVRCKGTSIFSKIHFSGENAYEEGDSVVNLQLEKQCTVMYRKV